MGAERDGSNTAAKSSITDNIFSLFNTKPDKRIIASNREFTGKRAENFIAEAAARGAPVATGRFRANMQVALVNDGPVTLVVDL